MTLLLGPRGRAALARLAGSRSLLAFDLDGTLAPIVRDPERARPRPSTLRLLRRVSRVYPVAFVSGRALKGLRSRLPGVRSWAMLGNHGAEEMGRRRRRPPRAVATWARGLGERLRGVPGVWIERKRYTLTVHYREAPRRRQAERAVYAAGRAVCRGARLVHGAFGMNVIPPSAPDKGTALVSLLRRQYWDAALYAGDDGSDEAAFAVRFPGLVTVRIGPRRGSRARFHLKDQKDIDRLLAELLRLRSGARRSGPRRPGGRRSGARA